MSEQHFDLTKIRPKDAAPWTFDQRDVIFFGNRRRWLSPKGGMETFLPRDAHRDRAVGGALKFTRDLRASGCQITKGEDFDGCQIRMANAEMREGGQARQ
jgi:hypothetical protein